MNDGTITSADIMQINSYYPFGLNMEGNWNGAAGNNKYTYNGKEWNDDFGLGWNHHDWRFYDPSIARWHAIDPKIEENQEEWSPYSFSYNNPIRFDDPDGQLPEEMEDGGKKKKARDAAKSVGAWGGTVGTESKKARELYKKEASKLVDKTEANRIKRAELKETVRAKTPEPVRSMIERQRPIAAEKAKAVEGKVNNPAKTNAAADKFANNLGKAGAGLTILSAGISVYNIATSEEPVKQTVKEAGTWAGAISGGKVGAEGGAAIGGPWGALIGGIAGSMIGGWLGDKVASGAVDTKSKNDIPAEHFNHD